MVYQHPLAYLLGIEGLALLRAWAGDHDSDQRFVEARIAEVRRLVADPVLTGHPGVTVERGATGAAYAQWSATYDDPGNGLLDLDAPVVDRVLDTLPAGTAVDAACGTGRLAARLIARGHRVIGVDASVPMLDRARRRLPSARFEVGDLRSLPVDDGAADLVVTGLALTHVADLSAVFAEFARVLRPGGHLIVSDVHPDWVLLGSVVKGVGPGGQAQQAATHRHTATEHLRAALTAGFAVRACEERPLPASPQEPPREAGGDVHEAPGAARAEEPRGVGRWQDWPWSLLGSAPEAARAAWDSPAVIVWHFQHEGAGEPT